ncbi:MAG TPA: discoidin domain-containing protein [Clostridia bacterium]|nr:discoidin domain-containing protein [Clostridia bacterium]
MKISQQTILFGLLATVLATAVAPAKERSESSRAAAAQLKAGPLTLTARHDAAGVVVSLQNEQGVEFAGGTAFYQVELKDGRTLVPRVVLGSGNRRRLVVTAKWPDLELSHEFAVSPGKDGFVEKIRITNTGPAPLELKDFRFGLRRPAAHKGLMRAVAVPFRRQSDGRLRDWSLEELAAGKGSNSDWQNDGAVPRLPIVDSARGRLRSEGWILTDGQSGLLVAKYNQANIDFSMLEWRADAASGLVFGGAGPCLYGEPESMRVLLPGPTVSLGDTYYLGVNGDWPAGYTRFRELLAELGHGLTKDYQPPVNWNELFDVGWYHSDSSALARHYTREALLKEARKAAEVGAHLLYLDPGWEVCEGTSLWAEDRLGTVSSLVEALRTDYGLGLGFRTIGRVYRDEFPPDWYLQPSTNAVAYERPCLNRPPLPEPVADKNERGCRNLALLPEARASASSLLSGYAIHQVAHLNDGWYGNSASWISAAEPSWVQVDLGAVYKIDQVLVGSEHTPHFKDRAATALRVLLCSTPAGVPVTADQWRAVADYQGEPILGTTTFTFPAQDARLVRIETSSAANGNVRYDEIEVYESAPHPWQAQPRRRDLPAAVPCEPIAFWEVCTQNPAWQTEKLRRLERIAGQGMRFMMFDEFDWRGPCYSTVHGHPVPSTPEGHVRAVYSLIHRLKQQVPSLLVEAHDPVWPWGVRYLPVYFDQTLNPSRRPGSYEENWGFEFMWKPIEDLLSGRALCLYYYNLGCDIPLYDHITAEYDNDACLGFWWYASTIRHLGIGGKKGLDSAHVNEARWRAYRTAMQQYNRLRDWLVGGRFIGIDEWTHLHVLPGRPGGVLLVFNTADRDVEKIIRLTAADLQLKPGQRQPEISGAQARQVKDGLELTVTIPARSPLVVEIGATRSQK